MTAAAAGLSSSCFRAPSGSIHLPATQNIDIPLLKLSFFIIFNEPKAFGTTELIALVIFFFFFFI